MQKRKIVWIVEHCETKGSYIFERAATLAQLLKEETVFLFVRTDDKRIIGELAKTVLNIISIANKGINLITVEIFCNAEPNFLLNEFTIIKNTL